MLLPLDFSIKYPKLRTKSEVRKKTVHMEKKKEKKGTKLVFSPQLILSEFSSPVLDLPILGLHCCSSS
jgi:hypothetical protein